VVLSAASLADEQGLDAVTLGALALRLGVRTPSLYNHIAGLSGLRCELALLGIRELSRRLARAALGTSGDDAVRSIALAYRAFAREHPGLYAASLRPDVRDPEQQEAGREVVDIALAVLAPYGLRGDAAIHAVRGLRSALHGFASLEAAGAFDLPLDRDQSFEYLICLFISGLRRQ
jgi:AcrR family transcriptional regulator